MRPPLFFKPALKLSAVCFCRNGEAWRRDAALLSRLNFSFFPAVILNKQIRIPRSLSVKAASVLKGFLNKVRRVWA